MIRYTVKITGHEAPFKWEVHRTNATGSKVTPPNCRGEADTREAALLDAGEAAQSAEWDRKHAATTMEEELFSVPDQEPAPQVGVPSNLSGLVFGD